MRYLVTGGAGFIGSHLVERLVAEGHEVVVLDDLSAGRREHLANVRNRIRFIRGSVLSAEACRRATEGCDYILHHAAITSVPLSTSDPITAHAVNTTGTVNILFAAHRANVRRVVFAGSTSAYGDTPELPNHEEQLPRPLSPYAASSTARTQARPHQVAAREVARRGGMRANVTAVVAEALMASAAG